MTRRTVRVLQEKGMYEVISPDEVKAVLGGRQLMKTDWSRNDWLLAKQVGRALHAEYALLVERSVVMMTSFVEMVLINTETDKKFRVVARATKQPGANGEGYGKVIGIFHQELFRNAMGDMLATAIRKSRPEITRTPSPMTGQAALPPGSTTAPAGRPSPVPPAKSSPPEEPVAVAPISSPTTSPSPWPAPSSSFTAESRVDLEQAPQAEVQVERRHQLAVYDLEAAEQHKVVALILSEALREELLKLHFRLVNRENINKVLEEMALQQTGLVDEKAAVKAGRGMAVQQIVLGRYGTLGKFSILQAKRLDVETQKALGIGSLKCDVGREDELLQQMAELAKKISEDK